MYLSTPIKGLVTKAQSGFFTVETESGEKVICTIPGRLKKVWQDTDLVAAGDRVTIAIHDEGQGTIESVAPRESVLSRAKPNPEKRSLLTDQEQVLLANPDQAVLVFSIHRPDPSLRKLDRFLVVAERNHLPAIICVNKIDLARPGQAEELFHVYKEIGYPVLYTSAVRGDGIEALREALRGKISVLAGSSGVGKTSLLNAIQPGLGRRVKEVSKATEKGLHTTRHVELVPLAVGGYVADTPGIRALALYDLEPGELDGYFREIAPLVAGCQFSDCSHQHEPNCAVRAAVAEGRVSPERYESYLRLREEHEMLDQAAY
ncbi:MAG: ribosome small subunit-dependent GTPase A [Chloroflexi bacterium]|nr:ribosome small subunit-dependent GTPase A [Chloroflexota bacterium]MCI0575888.1 ribosome small subunit-dependent GTPase A [Chloroflexota bacterium]MCI0648554.1 ribosome small subunit-dependent GTPase A [Chloroflexota bacterium]MCI0727317.1 ribosome small subunit-dependent GTPase A [Chloroflexota bacterium]